MVALKGYPSVEIFQLQFHNRILNCFPYMPPEPEAGGHEATWALPVRAGSLAARLNALHVAEASAAKAKEEAGIRCAAFASLHSDRR